MPATLQVAPSMGCCDLYDFAHQVSYIGERSDFLHIDVKDGVYVPTFGVGPEFVAALKRRCTTPMDAHLMVEHPQDHIEAFAAAGVSYITPHTDCIERDAFVTFNRILDCGCKAGVALSPAAPLSAIEYYLPILSKVTVMIVDPGIAGQRVIESQYDKIAELARIRRERGLDFLIEADGSMNADVYRPLYEAGADVVVLGPPALWNKDADIERAWSVMEDEMATALSGAQRA